MPSDRGSFGWATYQPGEGATLHFLTDGKVRNSENLTPGEAMNIVETLVKFVRDSVQKGGGDGR